jgi:hypothetical protein
MWRKWHFLAAEPFSEVQESQLRTALQMLLKNWHTHGRPVHWEVSFTVRQFIEISTQETLSGCSIDTLFRAIQEAARTAGILLLSTEWVAVWNGEKVITKKFYEIVKSHEEGRWPESWQLLEPAAEGIRKVPLSESRIAIHLK